VLDSALWLAQIYNALQLESESFEQLKFVAQRAISFGKLGHWINAVLNCAIAGKVDQLTTKESISELKGSNLVNSLKKKLICKTTERY